jgi:hypothetical protein
MLYPLSYEGGTSVRTSNVFASKSTLSLRHVDSRFFAALFRAKQAIESATVEGAEIEGAAMDISV